MYVLSRKCESEGSMRDRRFSEDPRIVETYTYICMYVYVGVAFFVWFTTAMCLFFYSSIKPSHLAEPMNSTRRIGPTNLPALLRLSKQHPSHGPAYNT